VARAAIDRKDLEMIRKLAGVWGLLLLPLLMTVACDVEKTREGNIDLPKYEVEQVEEGDVTLPAYDVDLPDVDVNVRETTVTLPDIDIDVNERETTIPVPDIDINPPANP